MCNYGGVRIRTGFWELLGGCVNGYFTPALSIDNQIFIDFGCHHDGVIHAYLNVAAN